jgi:hypothetical protein
MLNHIALSISISQELNKYQKLLSLLDINYICHNNSWYGFGNISPFLWLGHKDNYLSHFCLETNDKQKVKDFYCKAINLGFICNGPPKTRLMYFKHYGCYLKDLSGNSFGLIYKPSQIFQ